MQGIATLTTNLLTIRQRAFTWRTEASVAKKAVMALGMACATGLMAQARIPLPWTPVPITGQTFAVLLAGVLLGRSWGGISMGLYVLLGVAGIPWFTGAAAGLAVITGPTGGYIAGFIPAALLVGAMVDARPENRRFWPMVATMLLVDYVLIHGLGTLQLGLWSTSVTGQSPSIMALIMKSAGIFLAVDAVKVVTAAAAATTLLPKSES